MMRLGYYALPSLCIAIGFTFIFSCGGGGGGGGGDAELKGGASGPLPAAPFGLTAQAVAGGTVYLSWEAGSTELRGYEVYRATTGTGTLYWVGGLNKTLMSWHGTYHYDESADPETDYFYAVRAYDDNGSADRADYVFSAMTERVPVTTPAAATSLPNAPSNPLLTQVAPETLRFQWQDNSSGSTQEDRFLVFRHVKSPYWPYNDGWYDWEPIFPYSTYPERNYCDFGTSGFTDGYIIHFRVTAQNAKGTSAYSDSVEWTFGAAWSAAAPSGLTATAQSSSAIQLSWTDNTADEDGFRVERDEGGSGTYSVAGQTGAGVVTFTDTDLQENTAYTYRVAALKGSDFSAWSSTDSAVTHTAVQFAPTPPDGVAALALSASQIRVTWNDNSDNESWFKVLRSTLPGEGFTEVKITEANATAWTENGLAQATTYYYLMTAVNGAGESLLSDGGAYVGARTASLPVPNPPTGLGAAAASPTSIALSWTDASGDETGFKIQRSTAASSGYVQVGAVGAGTVSYTDLGLSPATTYYYRVRAYNGSGDSAYASASAATPAANSGPAAPSGLTATPATTASIGLSWTDNSANETGFRLERAVSPAGSWTLVTITGTNTVAYTDTGRSADTVYYYRVRAEGTPASDYSAVASARTFAASLGVLRLVNNTHYALVDVRLDGAQTLGAAQWIPAGGTADLNVTPGGHTLAMGVGTVDDSGKSVWFEFAGSPSVAAGQTQTVQISMTVGQLLTGFASYRDYVGEYWTANNTIGWARYRFNSGGAWDLYDLAAPNSWTRLGGGTVQLSIWNDYAYTVSFRLCSSCEDVNFAYPFGSFMYRNGPQSWPVITYVGQ